MVGTSRSVVAFSNGELYVGWEGIFTKLATRNAKAQDEASGYRSLSYLSLNDRLTINPP